MAGSGHGMQIVKVLDDHSYQLDEKILEQVILQKEIKDLPVVVVSVAGVYRSGKSFLLNFFLRYLKSAQAAQQDGSWLGEDSEPLVGFDWRGGVTRNTTGIVLWSEPIITTLPSGEKVAVLLMDTQGTFDSKSTVRDNSTIFALSTLISSVQIYNISMNIQEDDLQYLQLFTMYGKMLQEKNSGGKAFQTLEFLVRDWPYPGDYSYGADGGSRLLQERLQINPDQPEELRELRTRIRSSFEKVLCFLMPHPGFKVQDPTFKGNISDIDSNFRIYLIQLVSSLLSTENLTFKTINGQKIKAGDLFNYFKVYTALFNSDQISSPTTILKATIEADMLSSQNEAREIYEKEMDSVCGPTKPAVTVEDLQNLHQKYLVTARAIFTKKKTMATEEEVKKYLDDSSKELENRSLIFKQINLSKIQTSMKQASDVYEEFIQNVINNEKPYVLLFDRRNLEAVQAAMKVYDACVKKLSNNSDQKRDELIQTLKNRYEELKKKNDINHIKAFEEEEEIIRMLKRKINRH